MDLSRTILEANRLFLVPKSSAHAQYIISEYRDPVTRHLNHEPPGSLPLLLERIEEQRAAMKAGQALFLSVLLKGSDEFIGCFALENIGSEQPEMGGWLKASAFGNRYGQEVAARIKQWAGDHLSYQHLLWPCAIENIASRKLAESLGGYIVREYDKRTSDGQTSQYVEYAIPRLAM
ncbi:MAG TPA: GNAT family N-acetyltransferase [Sphingomicrobium sp.]|nr:GNAT family N-acetyltransferase [Sphingomicrobium sp.]